MRKRKTKYKRELILRRCDIFVVRDGKIISHDWNISAKRIKRKEN